MRFYYKKFVLALLCLAAAAALTWKLFDIVENTKETVTLIQASRRVEKGARITSDMLRRVEVGAYGLDGQALDKEEAAVGKYAACDIFPGDALTLDKLKTIDEIADNYVQKTRENNLTAVSVQLKGVSAGMSGKLKTGDVVSAYVFVNEGGIGSNKGDVLVYPELQCLEIAAITNSRAEDIQYEPDREIDYDRVKTTGDAAIPATVVFIADERQAIRLVEAENTGVIHLVFKGRGEYARELLEQYNADCASNIESGNDAGAAVPDGGLNAASDVVDSIGESDDGVGAAPADQVAVTGPATEPETQATDATTSASMIGEAQFYPD